MASKVKIVRFETSAISGEDGMPSILGHLAARVPTGAACSTLGARSDSRNEMMDLRSCEERALYRAVTSTASPAWVSMAFSSVSARPSCRYGPESATPHRGAVLHSTGVGWSLATNLSLGTVGAGMIEP